MNRFASPPADTPAGEPLRVASALLDVPLPLHAAWVLEPDTSPVNGYTHYQRVR